MFWKMYPYSVFVSVKYLAPRTAPMECSPKFMFTLDAWAISSLVKLIATMCMLLTND